MIQNELCWLNSLQFHIIYTEKCAYGCYGSYSILVFFLIIELITSLHKSGLMCLWRQTAWINRSTKQQLQAISS